MSPTDQPGSAVAPKPGATDPTASGGKTVTESGTVRATTAEPISGATPRKSPDDTFDWGDEEIDRAVEIPTLEDVIEPPISDELSMEEGPDRYLGTVLSDRYVVDEVIGEGGMGKVYLAHHKVIGKRVALKILHAEHAKDKEAVGRFLREAKAASSVGNPHIIDVLDFGEAPDGAVYFAMEYLEGGTLGGLMEREGALDLKLVCDVALQLCDGLAAAHRQQIVHRDLKPDNVTLLTSGPLASEREHPFCKILDFGIAKVSTSSSSTKLTMAGAVFGTPHYMSPEQAAGDAVDHRTDIYSLGVMLYEMIAGKLPFHASNFMGILTQHMYKAPPAFGEIEGGPDVPRGLEAIVLKCLSKKPESRYQAMEGLAQDLRRFLSGEVPEAVHDMMARSGGFDVPADYFKSGRKDTAAGSRSRSGPKLVAAAGIAVAVGIVLFVLIKDATSVAQPPEPTADTPSGATLPVTTAPAPSGEREDGVERIEVLLHAKPEGATVVVRGVEQPVPTLVPVDKGHPITAEVKAEGYETQLVEIDGSTKKISIELEPASGAAPGPRPRPVPFKKKRKPSPAPVDGVVDPWGK